jgi:hypothetical protein
MYKYTHLSVWISTHTFVCVCECEFFVHPTEVSHTESTGRGEDRDGDHTTGHHKSKTRNWYWHPWRLLGRLISRKNMSVSCLVSGFDLLCTRQTGVPTLLGTWNSTFFLIFSPLWAFPLLLRRLQEEWLWRKASQVWRACDTGASLRCICFCTLNSALIRSCVNASSKELDNHCRWLVWLAVVAQRETLHELLHTLPPVTYAAAYGSAVNRASPSFSRILSAACQNAASDKVIGFSSNAHTHAFVCARVWIFLSVRSGDKADRLRGFRHGRSVSPSSFLRISYSRTRIYPPTHSSIVQSRQR